MSDRAAIVLLSAAVIAIALRQEHLRRIDHMADRAEFTAINDRLNTATNAIAARLQALEAKVTNAGLPADVEAAVLTELQALTAGLEALGADPENPVPEPAEPTPA
jgi:hypothetical protein